MNPYEPIEVNWIPPAMTYVRICRERTDSWMTIALPCPMNSFEEAEEYVHQSLPDWEVFTGSHFNPDSEPSTYRFFD